jgi:hypothetical protein
MMFTNDVYSIEFSEKEFKSLSYLPFEVEAQQVEKGIWKLTPDDHLNDQEHEKEFWSCKFLLATLHDAKILYALKDAIKKYTVRPEESFIKVTDREKIFAYVFFLEAKNLKLLEKQLLEFYKEVNVGLKKTPEETGEFFEIS